MEWSRTAGPGARLPMSRRTGLVVVISALLLLVGCGGTAPQTSGAGTPSSAMTSSAAPAPTPEPTSAAASPVVPVAPEVLDFAAPTIDGGTFEGASLAGKPAVFWFWAPWCPVCKRGAADVTAAAAELGDEVAVIGVAGLSGSINDMQRFVEDTGSGSLPHIADTEGAVFTRFEVTQQDTFAFVGTDGAVELVDGYSNDPDLVGIARERFGL
jgi:thiol-disulfide isomerase/thioredoxin